MSSIKDIYYYYLEEQPCAGYYLEDVEAHIKVYMSIKESLLSTTRRSAQ